MKSMRIAALTAVLGLMATSSVFASYYVRQYYTPAWTYAPASGYYYSTYYFQPTVVVVEPVYTYHYAIYYPAQPSYVYYYNPVTQVYWGRYKIGSTGEKQYSVLAEKDRRKDLKDIPESAFPELAAMPMIPKSADKVTMEPPPVDKLPKAAK